MHGSGGGCNIAAAASRTLFELFLRSAPITCVSPTPPPRAFPPYRGSSGAQTPRAAAASGGDGESSGGSNGDGVIAVVGDGALWDLLPRFVRRWGHHVEVADKWCALSSGLTCRLLRSLYGGHEGCSALRIYAGGSSSGGDETAASAVAASFIEIRWGARARALAAAVHPRTQPPALLISPLPVAAALCCLCKGRPS